MRTFSLKPGLAVRHNDRLWSFKRRLVDNRLLFNDELGEPWAVTEIEFYRHYNKRELTIELDQPYLGITPEVVNAPRDLTTFPEQHVEEAVRRRKYLDGLLDGNGSLPAKAEIPLRISAIAMAIADKKRPPSPVTAARWAMAYRASRCVVRLVPAHCNKGRRQVITGEIENILLDVVNEVYLTPERPSVAKVWFEFRGRILNHNRTVAPSQRLEAPSRMSVYRYVGRLDAYIVDCARYGKRVANQNHRVAATEMRVEHILDRWEIDHTPMDVLVVDLDTGKVIGRPYMTVIIDRASRLVMAFLIHLAAPNTESVLRTIDRAIRPKDHWLSLHPDVICAWRARGLPLRFFPDNAAEFHAGNLHLAFNDLGIEIMYPRTRGPEMKGAIERFFRTLNMGLLHCLPGTTRSNTKDRGDYPSEELACLTLPELDGMVLKWIVDVYHQTPHKGLHGRTPADVWKCGESERPIHLPADLDSLESILSMREQRVLQHYGVDLLGLRYNSPELGHLRQRLDVDEKVEVRYRDELASVWVYDARRKVFLSVPCTNKAVIGLSRDLYEHARKLVREAGGNDDNFESVHKAYRQIMDAVDVAKRSNKLRQRREAAKARLDKEGNARPKANSTKHVKSPVAPSIPSLKFDPASMSGFTVRSID